MARSPNPLIHINLSFSIDTPHEKIKLFESTAREFVKERPREWRAFEAFRVSFISVERGVVGKLKRRKGLSFLTIFFSQLRIQNAFDTPRTLAKHWRCPPKQSRCVVILFGAYKETQHALQQSSASGRPCHVHSQSNRFGRYAKVSDFRIKSDCGFHIPHAAKHLNSKQLQATVGTRTGQTLRGPSRRT